VTGSAHLHLVMAGLAPAIHVLNPSAQLRPWTEAHDGGKGVDGWDEQLCLVGPCCVVADHGVEGDDHLAHDGGEGELGRLAGCDEAVIDAGKGPFAGADGAQGGH